MLLPVNAVFGDFFDWSVKGSLFLFAADNGPRADALPVIGSLGFSLSWQIVDSLRIEFSEDIYYTNYEFNKELGFPMACGNENRSAFVLGFITSVQAVGAFPVGTNGIMLRVFGGPAADFRVVTLAFGLHPDDLDSANENNVHEHTSAVLNYFWSKGRWFMPVLGTGMDFPATENYLIGFDLRVFFPIYKLWTDDKTPMIDGWRFGVSFRITPRS